MHFCDLPSLTPQNLACLSLFMYKYKDFVIKRYETRRNTIWNSVCHSLYPKEAWKPTHNIQDIKYYINDDNIRVLSHAGHSIRLGVPEDVVKNLEVCVFQTGKAFDINLVVDLYELDGAYACKWRDLPYLLEYFSNDISDLFLPPNHRIPKTLFPEFLTTVHNNRKVYLSPQQKKDDTLYGAFSWPSVYKYVEWDFDMVEKYKDKIVWSIFLKYNTNLNWEEKHFEQFHTYLLKYITWNDVCLPNYFSSVIPFSYLWKYRESIDFEGILKNSNLSLTVEGLQLLFNYLKDKEVTNGAFIDSSMQKRVTYKTEFYDFILRNRNFIWADEVLRFCSKQAYENSIRPVAQNYSTAYNTKEIIDDLLNVENYYTASQQRNIAFEFYEQFAENSRHALTKDIVVENCESWNQKARFQFTGYTYGSDVWDNYHEVTGWEEYVCKKYALTYEACKVLSQQTARIGGLMLIDHGDNPESNVSELDHDYQCNALLLCSRNEIANQQELNKIVLDSEILEYFMYMNNNLVIDYAIELFFANYSYDTFKETKISMPYCKFACDDEKLKSKLTSLFNHIKV